MASKFQAFKPRTYVDQVTAVRLCGPNPHSQKSILTALNHQTAILMATLTEIARFDMIQHRDDMIQPNIPKELQLRIEKCRWGTHTISLYYKDKDGKHVNYFPWSDPGLFSVHEEGHEEGHTELVYMTRSGVWITHATLDFT